MYFKKYFAVFSFLILSTSVESQIYNITGSLDTLSRSCPSGTTYLGPNKAHEHGGSCVSSSGWPPLDAIYTLDKESCSDMDMIYVGPWKAYKHGGFCVNRGRAFPSLSRDCSAYNPPQANYIRTMYLNNIESQVGEFVYVGPRKAHEHGGYCYSAYNSSFLP